MPRYLLSPQFGLTPDKIGLVFLAGSIPYALFAPISGALADKIVGLAIALQLFINIFYHDSRVQDS